MSKAELTKYINILSFVLWLGILINIVLDDTNNLKVKCILLLVYVLIDSAKNIWDSKDVK